MFSLLSIHHHHSLCLSIIILQTSPSSTTFPFLHHILFFSSLCQSVTPPPCLSSTLLSLLFRCLFHALQTHVCTNTHTHTQGGSTSEHPRQTITVWNSGYYSSSRALLYLPSTILPPSLTHTSCLRGGERGRERMRWERERQGEGEGGK